MEALLNSEIFLQLGITGVVLLITIKALAKVYSDMRADATKREERLMDYLDKKIINDREVADTLKELTHKLSELNVCINDHVKDKH